MKLWQWQKGNMLQFWNMPIGETVILITNMPLEQKIYIIVTLWFPIFSQLFNVQHSVRTNFPKMLRKDWLPLIVLYLFDVKKSYYLSMYDLNWNILLLLSSFFGWNFICFFMKYNSFLTLQFISSKLFFCFKIQSFFVSFSSFSQKLCNTIKIYN